MDEKVNRIKRPSHITVVSLFYLLNALALGAIGVVITLSSIVPYFDSTMPRSQASEEVSGILLFGGIVVGIIALAIFIAVVGYGLWRLKSWARRAAIVISSLISVINLILFVNGIINGQPTIPYGIVFHGLVLWALSSMSTKSVFEPVGIDTDSDTTISEVICPNCGNSALPKDRFCRKCGSPLR